jgi:uncharacterized protein (TIGR03545 family)
MSTAGSVRSAVASPYGPPAAGSGTPPNASHATRNRVAFFRWRGIIPLALGLALVAALWSFFGERTLRSTMEEAGTKALGTELDVADLKIRLAQSAVELGGIAIADPFDARRNLVEVKELFVELEPAPLLEKKLVVSRLTISGVRTGRTRTTPARPVAAGGFAPAALRQMQQWAKQFDVPLLSLTPIDTIKSIVLDPAQLASVKAALALAQRADSTRATLERSYATLRLQETVDSSRALLTRLQGMNVRTLGIQGARTAVTDVRRTASQVDSARRRVETLATIARVAVDSLEGALRSIDDARKADYAFARRLIRLPSFDAPDIGAALFGKVTIDKVQQALYWTALARQYMPPGLLPKESDGPKRLRASGTTVHFVKPQAYPRFLLRRADLTVDVTDGPARGSYIAAVTNATTEPALVGAPTVFAARRAAAGTGIDSLRVAGSLDHVKAKPRDVLTVQAGGVALPTFPIPGLPYRGDPGRGASELRLTLDGDQLAAHWTLSTRKLAWIADSAAKKLNTIESLVARVLTGVASLQMNADVTGTLQAPKLAVSSNLDRVVADQLKSVAGEQVAAAEAKVRARVDSLVAEKSAPIKARVAEIRADADKRVADARAKLDAEKTKLDAQLKALSGGLVGLP